MPAQLVLARRAAAGLQVHHDRAALIIRLQPVHPAGDLHLADPHLERLLHRDELARVLRVPVEEPPHHALGQRALLGAVPGAPEVEMVPDFIDAISHGPFGSTLGSQYGGGVDHRAQVAQDVRPARTDRGLKQPAEPAPGERLDLGRGQPDRLAAGHDRAGVGQLGQRVPLARVGRADPGGGQPGQLGRRGLPDGRRALGVGGGPAQVGDQSGHGQPAVLALPDPLDSDVVARQLGQEPGRSLVGVLAAGRGDNEPFLRAGDGDVEQPALLGQQLGRQQGGVDVGAGILTGAARGLGQLVDAQQRAAHAQVRPGLLLDAGHHHDVPLQALGAVRGQDADAVVPHGPFGQGVAGDLLAGQAVGEQGGHAGRHAVGEVRGLVEQRQHRVQVPVGGRARRAARRAGLMPMRSQAGGVPDGPEHVLGAAALLDGVPGGGEQAGQPLGRRRHPVRHHGQVLRVEQGAGEHIRGALALRVGVGEQLEGPAQAAQAEGVGAAQRAAEELGRGGLVEVGLVQGAAEQHQQRAGAGFLGQRQLVPGHRDRDVGRGQGPAQQRHLPGRRADQDGHVRPGHPVGQVRAAQRVGDQRGLLLRRGQPIVELVGPPGCPAWAPAAGAGPGRRLPPARPGAGAPPGGTRPAGHCRCGGRCAAPPPARAGRPRCGTGPGTR